MTSFDQKMNHPPAFELPEMYVPNPKLGRRGMFRDFAGFSRAHILNRLSGVLLHVARTGYTITSADGVNDLADATAKLKAAAAGGWKE